MTEELAERRSREWSSIVVLAGVVLVSRLIGVYVRHIYDDAFITFRYAENLANGMGFVYNAGEWVLGTTSPLWGLILTPLVWTGIPLPTLVPFLNVALDCTTVLLVLLWCRRRSQMLMGVLLALAISIDPHMVRIPVGGMESSLFLLVSVVALGAWERRPLVGVGLAAGSYFIRPEGILLTAVLVLAVLVKGDWRKSLQMAGLALLIVALPTAGIWACYGKPVSQSVLSKAGGIGGDVLNVLTEQFGLNPFHLFSLPLVVYGVIVCVRRRGLLVLAAVWAGLYVLVYLVMRPFCWGWYFHSVHFVKFLLAAVGLADLMTRLGWTRRLPLEVWSIGGSAFVLAVGILVALKAGSAPVRRNVYGRMKAWFRQHPDGTALVLAHDIGAVGYYSGARILDMARLVTPDVSPEMDSAVARCRPEYLFLVASREHAGRALQPDYQCQYMPTARFSKTADTSLDVTPDGLPSGWRQDYILFGRIGAGP